MAKGYKHTEETIRKRTETRRRNGWNKNPEETRRKMSEAKQNMSEETRRKMSEAKQNMSEETKRKMRVARATRILPVKDTKIEVKIQNFLKELGIEFFTHQYMNIEHGYQCDILIPSLNMVIECDGDYWHKYPTGTDNDHVRTKELIEKGFKVLRLWEHEINEMIINDFKIRLEEAK